MDKKFTFLLVALGSVVFQAVGNITEIVKSNLNKFRIFLIFVFFLFNLFFVFL